MRRTLKRFMLAAVIPTVLAFLLPALADAQGRPPGGGSGGGGGGPLAAPPAGRRRPAGAEPVPRRRRRAPRRRGRPAARQLRWQGLLRRPRLLWRLLRVSLLGFGWGWGWGYPYWGGPWGYPYP